MSNTQPSVDLPFLDPETHKIHTQAQKPRCSYQIFLNYLNLNLNGIIGPAQHIWQLIFSYVDDYLKTHSIYKYL